MVKFKNNKWTAVDKKGWDPVYKKFLLKCLNSFNQAFNRAKEVSEFEFIFSLLNAKRETGPGWNSWESTEEAINSIINLHKKIRDFETNRHIFLWTYGHIVEASFPYELMANLLSIANGERYNTNRFPDKQKGKYLIPQCPSEKIVQLKELAKKANLSNVVVRFTEVLDRELRNAVFHSDYALYNLEVRILKGKGKIYSNEEVQTLINKSLAYLSAIETLVDFHKESYSSPKIVKVPSVFGNNKQAKVIIRKGEGLVGIKDCCTSEEIKKGGNTFRLGIFMSYELRMLDNDCSLYVLPRNRIRIFNYWNSFLPGFIRTRTVKILQKTRWFS